MEECFLLKTFEFVCRVLNEILETSKYEENDVKVILQSYAKNPAAAQAARRFVQDNWKEIVKR